MANLLPGQKILTGPNGLQFSNFLFGSNMSQDFAANTSRNTPAIQKQIKAGNFQLMRCAIPAGSTNAYIDLTANACQAMGCAMLVILIHNNLAWNQSLVSYLGNRCLLYEFGNEPDLYPITGTQYLAFWNSQIPSLRSINPNAAFIGPVLGVFANLTSFCTPWLQGTLAAGTVADGFSYHVYPCTGDSSQSDCATKSTNYSKCFGQVDALVKSILGHSLPQCMTEWNIDASAPPQPYTQDPAFAGTWVTQALNNMAQAGFAMACQWDAAGGAAGGQDDMISTQSPYSPQVEYQPIVNVISQYMGSPTNSRLVGPDTPVGITQGTKTNSALDPNFLSDMKTMGLRWLRWQPYANAIELSKGVYTWGNLDSVVKACNSAGVNLILTVLFPPAWGLLPNGVPSPSWTQAFATAMATRYDGNHGFGIIQGIELGNEDYGFPDDPTDLCNTMNLCYKPLKNAYPTLTIGPGAALHRNTSLITTWFQTLWSKSAGNFDYANFHYYTENNSSPDPSIGGSTFSSYPQMLTIMQNAASSAGAPNFPIWITETGFPINSNGGFTAPYIVDQATQWNYIKYELDQSKALNQPAKVFLYTLSYLNTPPSQGVGNSHGMSLYQGIHGQPGSFATTAYTSLESYPENWGGGSNPGTTQRVKDAMMRVRIKMGSGTNTFDVLCRAGIRLPTNLDTKDVMCRANITGAASDTFQRAVGPSWGNASDGENWVQASGTATQSIVYSSGDGVTIGLNPGLGVAAAPYTFWNLLLPDMAKLGISWLRFQNSWRNIELTQGTYNWQALDDAVSHCNAAGIRILYTIRDAPTWALLNPAQLMSSDPFYQMDPTLAAGFATAVMNRYNGGAQGHIDAIGFNEDFNIHNLSVNDTFTLNQQVNSGTPYSSLAISPLGFASGQFTPLVNSYIYFQGYNNANHTTLSQNVNAGDSTAHVNSITPNATFNNHTFTLNQTVTSGQSYTSVTINAAASAIVVNSLVYFNGFGGSDVAELSVAVNQNDTTINIVAPGTSSAFVPGNTYNAGTTLTIADTKLLIAYIGYHNSPYPYYNALAGNTTNTKTQPARDSYFASPVYKAIYTAIRKINPTIPIGLPLMWALQPVNAGIPNTNVSNYTAFMQQMYNDGIKNYMDASTWIDFHYYSKGVDPNTGASDTSTIGQAVLDLQNVAAANGDAGRAIWVTEYGWQVPGEVATQAIQATNYSELLTATAGPKNKRFFFTLDYKTSGAAQSSLVQFSGGVYTYNTAFTTTLVSGLPTVGQLTGVSGTSGADTFVRANQSGWGTASDGETWTLYGTGTASIASNEGVLISTGIDSNMQLGTQTAADADVRCRIAIGNSGDTCAIQARFTGVAGSGTNTTTYKLLFYTGAIHINKSISGTITNLANSTFTMTPGTFYQFRLTLSGSTIQGKVWQDGTTEPTSYQMTVSDTSIVAAGGIAVLAKTVTGSSGVQFDHLSFTSAAAQTTVMRLGIQTFADAEAIVRFAFPLFASTDSAGITLRDQGLTTFVRLRQTAQQVQLCQQTPAGGLLVLASYASAPAAGVASWMKFRAVGSNLYGKIWTDGTAEPQNWLLSAITTVTGAGQVGLACALSGADFAQFDHFQATAALTSGLQPNTQVKDVLCRAGVQGKSGTQTRDAMMRARLVDLSQNAVALTTYAAKKPPLVRKFPKS